MCVYCALELQFPSGECGYRNESVTRKRGSEGEKRGREGGREGEREKWNGGAKKEEVSS